MKSPKLLIAIGLLGGGLATSAQLKIHPAPSLDLGEFPAEAAPTARFELFNQGSKTLPIVEVISGCDCLEPIAYEKLIQPKESVPLDVLINGSLLSGPFKKEILIRIGGKNPTNAVLKIRGTARRAIPDAPQFIFAGRTAIGQPWETNLLLRVRADLTETPILRIEGNPNLHGELEKTQSKEAQMEPRPPIILHLRIPPQAEPFYWENRIILSFSESPAPPPTIINVNGYSGGTLHPSLQILKATAKGASFTLRRNGPSGTHPDPAPLICKTPGVDANETPLPGRVGQSTVQLTFSGEFLQQLKRETRIVLQLDAKGFIPITLAAEQ